MPGLCKPGQNRRQKMPLSYIFKSLATVVSIYTFLCFLRIIITWVPGLNYTPFGRFLSSVCDPYLNIFRRIRFLRFSALDLTPAIAICTLYAVSYLLISFSSKSFPSPGELIAHIISLLWGVVTSVLLFLAVIFIIRLLVILITRDYGSYGSIWEQLDNGLSPLVYKITAIFSGRKPLPYKTALILAVVILIFISAGGSFLIERLCTIIAKAF